MIHADNRATQGDGKPYCSGAGELSDEIEDGLIRKSYQWEPLLDR